MKANTIRELVSSCVQSGNMTQDVTNRETVEDIIGALARTDPLGAALWRVTGNMDAGSFREARALLIQRLSATWLATPVRYIERCAQVALEEYMLGRQYGELERTIRMSAPMPLDHRIFDRAHKELTDADGRVARQLSYQLERPDLEGKKRAAKSPVGPV